MSKRELYNIRTVSYYSLIIYTTLLLQKDQRLPWRKISGMLGSMLSRPQIKKAIQQLIEQKMVRVVGAIIIVHREVSTKQSTFAAFLSYLNSQLGTKYRESAPRKVAYSKLRDKYSSKEIKEAISEWKSSSFLSGTCSDWKCNLDWFLRPDNFVKVLEGKYDDPTPAVKKKGKASKKFQEGETTWSE